MRLGRGVDWVGGVEAIYALDCDDEAWLRGIAEAVRPGLDLGLGVMAWRYDVRDVDNPEFAPMVVSGGPDWSTQGPSLFQETHGPGFSAALYTEFPAVVTGRGALARMLGREDAFERTVGELPIRDFFAFRSSPTDAVGAIVGAGSTKALELGRTMRSRWLCLAAHLGGVFRLRERLRREDAVLRCDGRVEHAEGDAQHPSARQALREAARRMDRARGHLRKQDPWEAVSMWQVLVSGRWSLVDRFDTDGRRYLVAMRNPAPAAAFRALTAREAQVVTLASRGISSKLVGYHLGIGESTASTLLARALRKLGAKRTDLAMLAELALVDVLEESTPGTAGTRSR